MTKVTSVRRLFHQSSQLLEVQDLNTLMLLLNQHPIADDLDCRARFGVLQLTIHLRTEVSECLDFFHRKLFQHMDTLSRMRPLTLL